MVIIITGTTHTGKTKLAQELLEIYHYSYLSIDLLKMGLIRSNNTNLSVLDDIELTTYLWPIVKEIIKTAIENQQNLIIEGCYIPEKWQEDFDTKYLNKIKYYCLIMSENYIKKNFELIKATANCIEKRLDDNLNIENLIKDNAKNLQICQRWHYNYIYIDKEYKIKLIL